MTIVLFFLVCDKEAFDKNGRKKTGNLFFFLDFLFCVAVFGGGYLVVIPGSKLVAHA